MLSASRVSRGRAPRVKGLREAELMLFAEILDQVRNAVRTGKAGLFRHGQPTAHLVGSLKSLRHCCGK
jgi:hypothetical protein